MSVAVPCVTDVAMMHYFEMPRLGAYLATPLVYPTYYTQDAFGEAKKFEEEKAEDLRLKKEKAEEREAQINEAKEKGLEEPVFEPEEEQPEKVMVLTGTTTKMVLCMDTLGTNTLFAEAKYKDIMDLCEQCAACKSRSEIKEVDGQALFAIGVERRAAADDLEAGLPSLREDAKVAMQQPQDDKMKEIAEKGLDAVQRPLVEEICVKEFACLQAKMVVLKYFQQIQSFISQCVTVQPEVLNVLAAIAFLIGYTKAEVYPARKAMLKWQTLKGLFEGDKVDTFYSRLDACNLDIGRKELSNEQKLSFIKTLLPADMATFVTEESAKKIDPAFEVLFNFLNTAVDYRTSALKQMQAEYADRKKKCEEEEGAEPFAEPELTTVDDDFEGLDAA